MMKRVESAGEHQGRVVLDTAKEESLFQKRLRMELQSAPLDDSGAIVFSEVPDGSGDVTLAWCDVVGEVVNGTPSFGEYRIPRHAYDVYPYHHEDPSVQEALESLQAFVTRVLSVVGNASHGDG